MSEIELERKMKHDLVEEFESLNQKYWSKNLPNEVSFQEMVILVIMILYFPSVLAVFSQLIDSLFI